MDLPTAAIIVATLLGPILAVQAQKWLERGRAAEDRKMVIFRALMATRATRLVPAHVEALNAMPIEFYGKGKQLDGIMEAWRLYMEHLNRVTLGDAWISRRDDLYADLLQRMAEHLSYRFDKTQLQREVYLPLAHTHVEEDQRLIRQGLLQVLAGKQPLRMDVQSFPVDPDIRESDLEIRGLLTDWLKRQLRDGKSAPET